MRSHGQSPPLVISETQAPPTQLAAQEAIFFDQIGDRLPFAALEPSGQDQQQHLEGRRAITSASLYQSRWVSAVTTDRSSSGTERGQSIILAELQRRRESGLIKDTLSEDATSDPDDSDRSSDANSDAQNGLLISLWRGAVPLRQAYWVCGVMTNILWVALIVLAEATEIQPLVLLVVVLHLIYSVFITVAIWRSAGRYTGNRIWGDLARVSIAIGVIRTAADLFLRR